MPWAHLIQEIPSHSILIKKLWQWYLSSFSKYSSQKIIHLFQNLFHFSKCSLGTLYIYSRISSTFQNCFLKVSFGITISYLIMFLILSDISSMILTLRKSRSYRELTLDWGWSLRNMRDSTNNLIFFFFFFFFCTGL